MASCRVRRLGCVDYTEAYTRMRAFTDARRDQTPDEVWLLEHPPVYTLGVRAKPIRPANDVPVVTTDRGGDITYHGPGQPVIYTLIDLNRRGLGIRSLVQLLEQAVIDTLAALSIEAERRAGAPGVYVAGSKIAALGLRVRSGRSYHGLAFNAALDLTPFRAIDPCGYPDLKVVRLTDLRPGIGAPDAGERLLARVLELLGYTAGADAANGPPEK
jgi:lipoyl(octanoyl) transferase